MCADYMKKLILLKVIVLLLAGMPAVNGQSALHPQPSPTSITTLKYEKTYVKITYCRPHKRGRTVFGGMIPFGKVWRTGANEATEITVTHDIKMAGKKAARRHLHTVYNPLLRPVDHYCKQCIRAMGSL